MVSRELRPETEYHYAYQSLGRRLLLRKKMKDVLKHKKAYRLPYNAFIEGNVSTTFVRESRWSRS